MKNIFLLMLVVYALGFTNCANVQTNSETASNKEVQPKEMSTKPPSDNGVETSQTTSDSDSDLDVSIDYWEKQRNKALEIRKSPVGSDVKGVTIPEELDGIGDKSKTKLEEMRLQNFAVPMDFFDLAKKNLNKELVELPFATEIYVLDVGGNADKKEFTAFNFKDGATIPEENSDGQRKLKELANNFNLDLNDPNSRWLIRLKLLRMLDPKAKMILENIAEQYQAKFNRPLLVTSLVQPIDYAIELSKIDTGSFKVRENGEIPPHCTGMSFDLSIKQLTAEEQNFISNILTEMDKTGKVDAQYATGPNSTFHIFVL